MKIFCQVHGKPAVVVGYAPGRKGKPRAVVITQGILKDVALKDIVLDKPEETASNVETLRRKEA